MLTEKANEFLEQLGELFADRINGYTIEEQEDGPVLIITAPSPFEEDKEIVYSVQLEDGGNGYVLMQYVMMPFTDIPDDKLDELGRAICYIDPTLSYGNFILAKENNLVFLRQSVILPDDMDMTAALQYSVGNLFLMERIVFDRGNELFGFLNGQVTLEEIKASAEQ